MFLYSTEKQGKHSASPSAYSLIEPSSGNRISSGALEGETSEIQSSAAGTDNEDRRRRQWVRRPKGRRRVQSSREVMLSDIFQMLACA